MVFVRDDGRPVGLRELQAEGLDEAKFEAAIQFALNPENLQAYVIVGPAGNVVYTYPEGDRTHPS